MHRVLAFYGALANRLYRYRAAIWAVVVLCLGTFLGAVFLENGSGEQVYALGSMTLLVWALSLIVVVQIFSDPLPGIRPGDTVLVRIRIRLARAFRWFMVCATTALFGVVIMFSIRALGLLVRG